MSYRTRWTGQRQRLFSRSRSRDSLAVQRLDKRLEDLVEQYQRRGTRRPAEQETSRPEAHLLEQPRREETRGVGDQETRGPLMSTTTIEAAQVLKEWLEVGGCSSKVGSFKLKLKHSQVYLVADLVDMQPATTAVYQDSYPRWVWHALRAPLVSKVLSTRLFGGPRGNLL